MSLDVNMSNCLLVGIDLKLKITFDCHHYVFSVSLQTITLNSISNIK